MEKKRLQELAGILSENNMMQWRGPRPSKDKNVAAIEDAIEDMIKRFMKVEEFEEKAAKKVAKSIVIKILERL